MLTTGQSVSHFMILGEINRGGMGIVYRAFDTRLEREIALKFCRPNSSPTPSASGASCRKRARPRR